MKAFAVSLVACVLVPLLVLAQEGQGNLNTITSVQVRGGTVEIVGTKKPNFTTFTMTDPPRLVIDISEAVFSGVKEDLAVGNGTITGIRTASYGSEESAIARVLIGYEREVETDIQATGNSLVVSVVGAGAPAVAAAPPTAAPEETPAAEAAPGETAAQAAQEAEAEREQQERTAAQAAQAAEAEREQQERAAAQAARAAAAEREQQERAAAQAAAAEAQSVEEQRKAQARAEAERKSQAEAERVAAQRAEQERLAQARAAQEAQVAAERQRREAEARAAAEERQRREAQAAAEERKRQQAEERERRLAEAQAAAEERRQARASRPETRPPPEEGERLSVSSRRKTMTLVGFKQEPDSSRVFVRTNEPVSYTVSEGDRTVVLELRNTRIDMTNNTRALDTSFFDTAVASVDADAGPSRTVRVSIRLKEQVPYQTRQEGNEVTIEFQRPARR